MDYSDAYLREVLPGGFPPGGRVPLAVVEELRARTEREEVEREGLIERSTRWTYAMFSELRLGQVLADWWWLGFACFSRNVSIGVIDPATGTQGFGLTLHGNPTFSEGTSRSPGSVVFPRLGIKVPVVLQESSIEEHGPVHPVGATGTAWAVCNRKGTRGVMTAGHAVGGARSSVSFVGGGSGRVERTLYPVVDAAFVSAGHPSSGLTAMPILRFPAAGQGVMVDCAGGTVGRSVWSVEDSLGVTQTTAFMVKFFLDRACVPGDSGALIRTSVGSGSGGGGGDGVGLYFGAMANSKTPTGHAGLGLNFEQATWALDVTAYT